MGFYGFWDPTRKKSKSQKIPKIPGFLIWDLGSQKNPISKPPLSRVNKNTCLISCFKSVTSGNDSGSKYSNALELLLLSDFAFFSMTSFDFPMELESVLCAILLAILEVLR